MLVVTGPSGIGKSTLLVHAAYKLAKRFDGRVIYLDIRGYSEKSLTVSDILTDSLRAADVDRANIPRELHAKSSLYRAVVCAENCLVLLDNAEELPQIELLLPANRSCAAIIASRSNLYDLAGAEHIVLGPLNEWEARELFETIVGKSRVVQEGDAASSILRYCGYLPLAIRIAAARVASRPHRPISYLLNKMSDERARLSELQIGNLEMRTNLEISYRGQSEIARKLFRRLSLAPYREFPYWIASVLLQVDLTRSIEAMDSLVEAQLVAVSGTVDRGYYRLHDLLLAYARECLQAEESESDQVALKTRVAKEYALFVDCADRKMRPGERLMPAAFAGENSSLEEHRNGIIGDEPLSWFQNEHANLLRVMDESHDMREWELTWVLGFHISYFLEIQGYWQDWLHAAELALQSARTMHDDYYQALGLRILGRGFRETGEWVKAEESFNAALDLFRRLEDRRGQAEVLRSLGAIYRFRGLRSQALEVFRESLAIAELEGDVARQAAVLRSIGLLYRDLGDLQESIKYHEHGLTLFHDIRDHRGEAASLRNLGIVFIKVSDFGRADDCLQRSLAIYAELEESRGQASAMRNLGDLRVSEGRISEASEFYEKSLKAFRAIGDRHWEAATLRSRGDMFAAQGIIEKAIQEYSSALDAYQNLGDIPRQVQTLRRIGDMYDSNHAEEEARRAWQDALNLAESHGMEESIALAELLGGMSRERPRSSESNDV